MSFQVFVRWLVVVALALVTGTATADPPKAGKVKKLAPAAAIKTGFDDGWPHVVYDGEVGPACRVVERLKVVEGKPLYICWDPKDDRYHAYWGAVVSAGFFRINKLGVKEGRLFFLGVDEKRDEWEVWGDETKRWTSGMWDEEGFGGGDLVGGYGRSTLTMPSYPRRVSCDMEISNYILAEGEALWIKKEAAIGYVVCWGNHKSQIWKMVDKNLRYEEGQIRYEAKDDKDQWHAVSGKVVGKGYKWIGTVYYVKGQRRYAAQDDVGVEYIVRGEQETKFDEVLSFQIVDGKEVYVARRRQVARGANPLQ